MKEWYLCPICGQKILKIDPAKRIEGVYAKCNRCRQEVEIRNTKREPEPVAK